jgi:hypothetical protein
MSKQGHKGQKKSRKRDEGKHRLKLFITYFIVLILISGMLELITFGAFNLIRLFGLSIIGALVFTIMHDRMGERTQIDDVADF